MLLKKKNLVQKKTSKKKFVSGTQHGGFQFIVILTPLGVPFHPVVVIGLGKNLLFKSVLAHCDFLRFFPFFPFKIINVISLSESGTYYPKVCQCVCLPVNVLQKSTLRTRTMYLSLKSNSLSIFLSKRKVTNEN